jgi:Fe2+ transport system protein FeoA
MVSLYDLAIDKVAIIKKIDTCKHVKERLHSFGLIRGVKIKLLKSSPLACPKIYTCLNTKIAIRNKTAKLIEISYEK